MRRLGVGLVIAAAAAMLVVPAFAIYRKHERQAANARVLRAILVRLSHRPTYKPAGVYVGPTSSTLEPATVRGRGGARLVVYRFGARPNPTVNAQFGLLAYDRWLRDHDPAARREAVRDADWFVRTQQPDGRWLYNFDDNMIPGGHLDAPWGSAMAQGQAISLLERIYRMTGRTEYLRAAQRAFAPLERKVDAGGMKRCYGSCRFPVLEEYPTTPPTDVLNGFMFALVGVYDFASIAPHSDAAALFKAGLRTLHRLLPLYDSHGIGRYDLASGQVPDQLHEALQIFLLRALYALHHDQRFLVYADRWQANLARAPA